MNIKSITGKAILNTEDTEKVAAIITTVGRVTSLRGTEEEAIKVTNTINQATTSSLNLVLMSHLFHFKKTFTLSMKT